MSRYTVLIVCGIIFLAGCTTSDELDYVERPATEIYNTALDALQSGNYDDAAAEFVEVERQHPYSVWARRAILLSAYAYYVDEEYDQAILAAERYIMLYPGGERASYAYYLIAICFYEQITDVTRDQRRTEEALAALEEVVRRFPDTEYARDSAFKIDLARDHLAGKEMEVGRYYISQEAYAAAIGRFREVLARYQTTTHAPEALHRLTEAYLALGLRGEAESSAAILGYNYPASEWYQHSYALVGDPSYQPPSDDAEESSFFEQLRGRFF